MTSTDFLVPWGFLGGLGTSSSEKRTLRASLQSQLLLKQGNLDLNSAATLPQRGCGGSQNSRSNLPSWIAKMKESSSWKTHSC
ncbi:hypothetical protein Lal_00025608 [Lupinus albus]|nr:hypothetical protein Lal_00025608 [Lupinus albus]